MTPQTDAGRPRLHRRIEVETPEHVHFEYQLADLGSRAAALLLDLAIILVAVIVVDRIAYAAGAAGSVMLGLSRSVLIFVVFLATWAYFFLFEAFREGRTPGKRALGVRVLHAGGEPLSLQGAVLRNLLRIVDLQVVGVVGAASIIFNRRAQRLGDLVAGTIVVHDAGGHEVPGERTAGPGRPGRPVLSVQQFELLDGYVARRAGLKPAVRGRVAGSVWEAVAEAAASEIAAKSAAGPDRNASGRAPVPAGGGVVGDGHIAGNVGESADRADRAMSGRADWAVSGRTPMPGGSASGRDQIAGSAEAAVDAADGKVPAAAAEPSDADARLILLHKREAPRHAARRGGANLQAAAMARERREAWAEYSALVEKGRRSGLGSLTEPEVRAFGRLYRGVTADLARARSYGASHGLRGTIERWAGAGHNLLYAAKGRAAVPLGSWLARDLPREVRRRHRLILLAALLLFGPMLVSYALVRDVPQRARSILPPELMTRAENTARGNIDAAYLDVSEGGRPVLTSAVMTNNVGVTITAFAGGIAAGVGTLLILVFNGIVIGAAFGVYANNGVLGVILAFVSPHGVMELTAICLAGAAGLGLGSAILLPGRRTRRQSLWERGRLFLSLLGGAAALLVVAGVVEGYYSPSGLPAVAKFAFGGATAVLLIAYFGFAGRGTEVRAGHPGQPASRRGK